MVPGTDPPQHLSVGSLVTGIRRFIDTVLCTSNNLNEGEMVTGITTAEGCLRTLQDGGEMVTDIATARRCLLALQDGGEMVT